MAIVRLDKASTTSHYVPEMVQEVEVIKVDAFRVLRDRIFIAEELEFANILAEWDTAVTNFEMRNSDEHTFADRFSKLNAKLVGHGAPSFPKPWVFQAVANAPAVGKI